MVINLLEPHQKSREVDPFALKKKPTPDLFCFNASPLGEELQEMVKEPIPRWDERIFFPFFMG